MICDKCGAENPDQAIKCFRCGNKIGIECKSCHTILPIDAKYCPFCGEKPDGFFATFKDVSQKNGRSGSKGSAILGLIVIAVIVIVAIFGNI